MAALSPQGRVAQLIVQGLVSGPTDARSGSPARQFALSCDPIVLFEGVPDLVLTFTILCSGQSSCDQVRSWYHVELRPHLGVKIHKLAHPEFVFSHEVPRELYMLARPERPPKRQTAIARQHGSEVVDCLPQVRRLGAPR